MRETFEANWDAWGWANAPTGFWNEQGHYTDPAIQWAWQGYRAAQSPSQPLVEVQEPVMTIGFDESEKCRSLPFGMKLYAAPVRGLPLTEERIMECRVWSGDGIATRFDKIAFARQIEAAHGIGAAPPSGSGEGPS